MRRSKGKQRLSNFAIGVIAIVLICIGVYGAFTKRVPFLKGYEIKAVVKSSNQLRKTSPVRIAGVNVGEVRKLEPGPGDTQILTMELKDKGLPVHQDATIKIRPRLFLEGGFYVDMRPGSPSAEHIKDGGTIPLPQTSTPVQFHQVLTVFNRPNRNSLDEMIKELAIALDQGGAEGINAANQALAPVLRDGAIVARASQGTEPRDLSKLVKETSEVTAAIASRDTELADLVTNLNTTTGALASQDINLAASLREFAGVLREAPGSLTALDRALPSVDRFAAALRPSLRKLPATLDDTSRVLTQLDGLVSAAELPRLITLLSPVLRDLPTLTRRLRVLLPLVGPVTDCVKDRVLPVLNAKLNDGDLTSGLTVWQELTQVGLGLGSASQSFDANGGNIRFSLGAGGNVVSTGVVPGVGQLSGSADQPILGARPRWMGSYANLPFRPDLECRRQAAPDLQSRTGLPAITTNTKVKPVRTPRLSLDQLKAIAAANDPLSEFKKDGEGG